MEKIIVSGEKKEFIKKRKWKIFIRKLGIIKRIWLKHWKELNNKTSKINIYSIIIKTIKYLKIIVINRFVKIRVLKIILLITSINKINRVLIL